VILAARVFASFLFVSVISIIPLTPIHIREIQLFVSFKLCVLDIEIW